MFTFEASEEKISFLNISIYRKNNKFETDVFYKKTDNHEYLPFKSCHPRHCKDNIPFTLARIVCSIVSEPQVKTQRLEELSMWLREAGYPEDKIWDSFQKVSEIDQKILRQKVQREKNDLITFVHTNNPRNPQVFGKLMKFVDCLRVGTNEKFNKVFSDVKFIPSRRQPSNLGDILTHSYFGTAKHDHGVKWCTRTSCITCKYMEEGTQVFFPNVGVCIKIKHKFSCESGYLLYKMTCQGCDEYYIGRTTCLKERLYNHKSKVLKYAENLDSFEGLDPDAPGNEWTHGNFDLFGPSSPDHKRWENCTKVYQHMSKCAKDQPLHFAIMPFLKIHYSKISEMAVVERHYIDWLKPGLNTL